MFDLAQHHTVWSSTSRSVRQFRVLVHFNFPTRRSVILRGVTFFALSQIFSEYLHESEFFRETILDCLSGTQMGSIHEEKKIAKNLVTLLL